ncbi:TetR family transcriptional regulator [Streptomyces sp. P6-2-1]|uniref:TetR/AcrR family transcriptional regulator n=1 Tax=unclassified Streptomyces TaxID=2593676 RepID=UPI003D36BC88
MADDETAREPRRRRGRPPKALTASGPGARERILDAARTAFAAHGYDRTPVRAVARLAGVDASLVHHYFGTKDALFAAAVEAHFAPTEGLADVIGAGTEGVGERLAAYFFGVWEDPATRTPLLALVRSALTHEAAAGVLRSLVLSRLLERIAGKLDVPDPRLRAELAASHLVGIALLRYVLGVEPLASEPASRLVAAVAPTLQRYLADPDPAVAGERTNDPS